MENNGPKFTNDNLIKIKQRSSDSGMLIDLVPVYNTFRDDNNVASKILNREYNLSEDWFKLGILADDLTKIGSIDNISALDLLEGIFEPYPYQLRVALNVLKDKSSIALLADEVGLGKTIEVGLIMKEHILRGNIYSVLVVTPKALVLQWKSELFEKFDENFIASEDEDFDYNSNKIIISFNKLSRNVDKFLGRQWDLIIVDEAHLLINTSSKRRQAITLIDRRYMLLCTATPLCNKLTDIYSIVDLLYPGILGTERNFKKKYFEDSTGRVCRTEMKNELKKIVSKVMVRTLRKDSGMPFTDRFVYSIRVNASHEENTLYDFVIRFLRKIYLGKDHSNILDIGKKIFGQSKKQKGSFLLMKELITLQQSLSSSPRALIKSLENRKLKNPTECEVIDQLIKLASNVYSYSKTEKLIETLIGIPDENAIIFTLRLETAYMLCDILNENFMIARVYEGRLSGYERQAIIEEFRNGKLKYIVATDSAAEGLNLQNASVVVNYDLHWNPMKIEQRIGRVHRRGQQKDVTVFNFVMKDTIDDYVLKVLYEKIDLFKMTIGGIESILSEIKDGDFDIEETIMDIILRHANKRDIEKEMNKLRQDMDFKKEQNRLREEFSQGVLD